VFPGAPFVPRDIQAAVVPAEEVLGSFWIDPQRMMVGVQPGVADRLPVTTAIA
jgi:hypothetical protein